MPTGRRIRIGVLSLVALASLATACERGRHKTSTAPRTSTALPPDEQPVGIGAIDGVRTENGGRGLVVVFVGSAPYDPANPCTLEYVAHATETNRTVAVRIAARKPLTTLPPSQGCTGEGYRRSVHVRLAKPLGKRTYVDVHSGRSIVPFDGATLYSPKLPAGWSLVDDGPMAEGMESDEWIQRWSPPRPTSTQALTCTAGPAAIELQQTPYTGDDMAPPIVPFPAVGVDVRGRIAVYWPANNGAGPTMGWAENHQWLALRARLVCPGDTFPTKDELIALAESLRRA